MAGDTVWLDVLPAMDGFATQLVKKSSDAAKKAGTSSGTEWGKSFKGSAGDAGSGAVVAELESAAKKTKRVVDDQTVAIGKARASQREAAAKVVEAEQRLQDARAKGDPSKVEAAELRLEAARDRSESTTRKLESVEGQLRAAQNEHKTVTGQLESATKGLRTETDKANDAAKEGDGAWGKLSTAFDTAKGKVSDFAGGLGGLATSVAGAVGGAALFSEAWSQNLDLNQGTAKVSAALDLTAEQSATAGEVAGSLYADSYGESLTDVTAAVGTVMSSFGGMKDASTEDLQEVAAQAMSVADVFNLDVSEASAAAARMIDIGFAGTATEAFDLVAASLQQVPEAMRGDVLDASNEYGGVLSSLGFTGQEAMGLLVQASEGGTIAIDKTGDALKELSIRATDMSTTSVAAYEAAGLNAEDMAARFLEGGETAKGAMDEMIQGLLSIEDPVERSNAAIGLFGTPLEDLGVNEIPAFLESLLHMDEGLGDVAGSAAEIDDKMAAAVDPVEGLKRGFMDMLSDGLEPVMGPATEFMTWAKDTPGVMTAVGVALGIVAVAWAAVTLAASPWLALGVGIAAVVGGIILAVQNWGTIVDWLREKWEPIAAWFSEKWTAIKDGIASAWQSVQDNLKKGWDWIGTNVFDPIKQGATWVGDRFDDTKTAIGDAWDAVQDGLKAGWDWINEKVFDPIKAGVDAVGQAFDTTQEFIRTAWDKIKSAAAKPVNFIIETVYTNGIKATWDKIATAVGLTSLKLPTVSPIRFAEGGVLPGYTPGRDVHHFWSPTGGRLDLSGGEGILRPDTLRNLGGKAWLDTMNRTRGRRQSFADGGQVSFWDTVGGVVSGIGSGIKNLVVDVAKVLSDPVGSLKSMLTAPVEALLGQVTGGQLGQMLVEIPRTVVTGIINKARDLIGNMFGDGGGPDMTGGSWVRPSRGSVTSGYGSRWGAFHNGIDFGGNLPVYAAGAGRVRRTGWNVGYGNTGLGVLISHGNGLETYYGHADPGEIRVRPGESVRAGQHISWGGNTGYSTGQHLHFSLFQNGRSLNPSRIGVYDNGGYLKPRGIATNLSTTPEPVLTNRQWQDISALAARGVDRSGMSLPSHVTLVDEQGGFIARTRVVAGEVLAGEMAGVSRVKRARGVA